MLTNWSLTILFIDQLYHMHSLAHLHSLNNFQNLVLFYDKLTIMVLLLKQSEKINLQPVSLLTSQHTSTGLTHHWHQLVTAVLRTRDAVGIPGLNLAMEVPAQGASLNDGQ